MATLAGRLGGAARGAKAPVRLPQEGGREKLIDRIGQLAGVALATSVLLGLVHKPSLSSGLWSNA